MGLSRVGAPKDRYWKRSPHLLVQKKIKGQVASTPDTNKEKEHETSSMKILVISRPSTRPIEWPPIGIPSEEYPLGAL